MPGIFNKSNRPKRPGAYTNFVARSQVAAPAPLLGTVAVTFTADWGPANEAVEVRSLGEYLAIFGDSTDTQGYSVVRQAFQGEGLAGRGGAANVIALRVANSSAEFAEVTLDNTSAANALTITAKYKGTRGNDLAVTVEVNATDATKNDLVVLDGTVELERFAHVADDLAALAASVNLVSNWVTASVDADGTALDTVSDVALTGGDDGSTLVSGDYTDSWELLETQRFSVFAIADVLGGSLCLALDAWVTSQNEAGKRFLVVVGGDTNESISTAVEDAAEFNSENVVRIGVGSVVDEVLGTLSTADLAPRIAGIIAGRGETASVTFARLAGVSIAVGATDAEILTALENGVVVVARDSNAEAPVRLEKGITTYTSDTTDKPKSIYSNIKFVRTIHGLEMEITEFAEANVIGRLPVNDATREYLVGQAYVILQARQEAGAIQPGWSVGVDQDPPPSDNDEFIGLVYSAQFGRDVEQLFNTIYVG
jgi:hypothetical protein